MATPRAGSTPTRREKGTVPRSKAGRAMIRRILEKLVLEYEPEKVILYGSYAYGTPDEASDIDLLIVKETKDRFIDRWTKVHRILRGTHPSVPLEPLVLTPREVAARLRRGDEFVKEILRKGELLYAA